MNMTKDPPQQDGPGSRHPAGSAVPRRPWLLSKQYDMTFVLSQDNEIVLGGNACRKLGDDVLRHIIAAVNAYSPNAEVRHGAKDASPD